jgi:hypothetical protein
VLFLGCECMLETLSRAMDADMSPKRVYTFLDAYIRYIWQ